MGNRTQHSSTDMPPCTMNDAYSLQAGINVMLGKPVSIEEQPKTSRWLKKSELNGTSHVACELPANQVPDSATVEKPESEGSSLSMLRQTAQEWETQQSSVEEVMEALTEELIGMGFERDEASRAIRTTSGDMEAAITTLVSESGKAAFVPVGASDEASENPVWRWDVADREVSSA